MASEQPTTLGALRQSGYRVRPVREEMRANLIEALRGGIDLFPRIQGYSDTVIPQLENAILSGHDIILLGERGQAKSRLIRSLVALLDEWVPVIGGSEISPPGASPRCTASCSTGWTRTRRPCSQWVSRRDTTSS